MDEMVMILFSRGQHKPGNLDLEPMTHIMNCACTQTTQGKETTTNSVWSDAHTIRRIGARTNMSFSSGRTDISFSLETKKGTGNGIRSLCSRTRWGNLKFRFQHGPFTKRVRPMVTRVQAVVLSISRFSRIAATRARIFALNKLTTEGAGTYSHFSPRPLRMSWLTYCCSIAVIACGIGLFRMARASSRLTSVQINTTKHFWVWGVATCLPPRRALTNA